MGKAELPLHAPGTKVDRGYIGQSVPRPNAQRLLQGRGTFTDDLRFPRLAHVAFLRSPYAHANIKKLDFSRALKSPGVAGVFDGAEVRLYVDGAKVAVTAGKGERKRNQLPLMIGADVSGDGGPNSFFKGKVDALRLSKGALYTGDKFEPVRRPTRDENTVLLTNMDAIMAGGVWLEAPGAMVAELIGAPALVPAE